MDFDLWAEISIPASFMTRMAVRLRLEARRPALAASQVSAWRGPEEPLGPSRDRAAFRLQMKMTRLFPDIFRLPFDG